jgi:peptidyl-prolyl isomerase G (cyclophilin G)
LLKYSYFLSFYFYSGSISGDEKSEKLEGIPHPLVTVTNIDPDEIPDVPSNRFLFRGDRTNDDDKTTKKKTLSPEEEEQLKEKRRAQIRGRTKSGRKVKGRGLLVINFIFTFEFPSL